MHLIGRPRAAITPILGVAVSASIFLVVAVSVALQPPDTSGVGSFGAAVAWVRTLLFCAALLAFVAAMIGFSRTGSADDQEAWDAEDDVAEDEDVAGFVAPGPAPVPVAPVVRSVEEAPMRFTMIAFGRDEEDARAIADFVNTDDLLAALRAWRLRYPEEQVHIFGPDGALLACRAAVPEPVVEPAPVFRRVPRPRLAAGGAA